MKNLFERMVARPWQAFMHAGNRVYVPLWGMFFSGIAVLVTSLHWASVNAVGIPWSLGWQVAWFASVSVTMLCIGHLIAIGIERHLYRKSFH